MIRTNLYTICIAATAVLAVSCNKIEEGPAAPGRTVITAVAEAVGGGTKAHNQYSYNVLWDKNDQIYVTDGSKGNTFTVSDESAGTGRGRFTEDTPSFGITGDIEAFYPSDLKTADGYNIRLGIQVPSRERGEQGHPARTAQQALPGLSH